MIRSRDESLFHQRMMIFYFFWKNDFHHETCSLSQIVDTTKIFEDVYRCHNLASARTLARPAVLLPLANNQPPMYTARLESECIAAIKLDTPAIQDLSLLYVWEGFGSLWKLSHSLSLSFSLAALSHRLNLNERAGDGSFSFNCSAVSRTSLNN